MISGLNGCRRMLLEDGICYGCAGLASRPVMYSKRCTGCNSTTNCVLQLMLLDFIIGMRGKSTDAFPFCKQWDHWIKDGSLMQQLSSLC